MCPDFNPSQKEIAAWKRKAVFAFLTDKCHLIYRVTDGGAAEPVVTRSFGRGDDDMPRAFSFYLVHAIVHRVLTDDDRIVVSGASLTNQLRMMFAISFSAPGYFDALMPGPTADTWIGTAPGLITFGFFHSWAYPFWLSEA